MSRKRTDAVKREALARRTTSRAVSRSDIRLGQALPAQAGMLLSLQQSFGNRAVTGLVQRWQEGLPRVGSAPGSPIVQRQFEDEDKVAEDAVGFMRGPAEQPETATPKPERVNESGLIDGEITSGVQPHAFSDGGNIADDKWHHCGGKGGKGVEDVGSATLVAPVFKTSPPGKDGMAKAWIRHGTGKVNVKRSYRGVTHGVQGSDGTFGSLWMSTRARDRVDKHERLHTKKTKELHDAHIKPLEERIDKYRGIVKAKKQDTSEADAQTALEAEINWDAVTDFADEDAVENEAGGKVDTTDQNAPDFWKDYPTKPEFQAKTGCDIYVGIGASKKEKSWPSSMT